MAGRAPRLYAQLGALQPVNTLSLDGNNKRRSSLVSSIYDPRIRSVGQVRAKQWTIDSYVWLHRIHQMQIDHVREHKTCLNS